MIGQIDVLNMLPGIASVLLAVSYGFRDMKRLRLLVVMASVIDLGFYYETHPTQSMWINIGNPVVLILINAYQLFLLHRESRPILFSEEATLLFRQLFSGLTPGEFHKLLEESTIETLVAGSLLTQKGKPVESVYALLTGELEVRIDGVVINRIERAGTLIGEVGYVTHAPASADVLALAECRVLRFSAETIERIRARRPDLHLKLTGILSSGIAQKLRDSDERLMQRLKALGEAV
jgi:CRP/FNR family transcriptional regulator, cyclic AMP receptor protein